LIYRKEIDGLRALALIPVILFHANFELFSGGFVGVDVFFVISGYLIASIILQEQEQGAFSIAKFYERRARRILPALFFITLCCVPFAWLWMLPSQQKDFAQSMAAVAFFISNIFFWDESGYFEAASEEKPLLHTWSLAVEEQFYLVFPLLVILLWRNKGNYLMVTVTALAVSSLLFSDYSSRHFPSANFYLSHTRAWELFVGVICALPQLDKFRKSNELLAATGLALIIYSIFAFSSETRFPSFYALVPVVGTCLIILFGSNGTVTAKLLSTRFLVGIGLISYSGYLWHQPLFAFARIRSMTEPSAALFLLLSVCALLLAYFSWRFVECPFRNRQKISTTFTIRSLSVFAAFVIGIGVFGSINKSFGDKTLSNGDKLSELDHRLRTNHGLAKRCNAFPVKQDCKTSDDPEILIWGDSFAMHLVQGVLSSNPDAKVVQMTKSTCEPSFYFVSYHQTHRVKRLAEECWDFNKKVLEWIDQNKSVKYAVLATPFGKFVNSSFEIMTDDGAFKLSTDITKLYFLKTLEALKQRGVKPVIFAPTPRSNFDIGLCVVRIIMFDDDLAVCDFRLSVSKQRQEAVIRYLSDIGEDYQVVWVSDEICKNEVCQAFTDGTIIYRDIAHLSYEGSAFIGKKMNFYDLITAPK
jgi:peptidoglycan/LPS O-acetylase OafA/YrhL